MAAFPWNHPNFVSRFQAFGAFDSCHLHPDASVSTTLVRQTIGTGHLSPISNSMFEHTGDMWIPVFENDSVSMAVATLKMRYGDWIDDDGNAGDRS